MTGSLMTAVKSKKTWFGVVGMLEQRLLETCAEENAIPKAAPELELRRWQKKCEKLLSHLQDTGYLHAEAEKYLSQSSINPAIFYKNRYVEGNLLHVAIWMDSPEGMAATGTSGGNTEALLQAKANPDSSATYLDGKNRRVNLQAIHIAAGLDSVAAMSALLVAVKEACPEGDSAAANLATDGLVNAYVTLDSDPYYTPLHEATFLSKKDAVLWLLDNDADPTREHMEGITPMHMLAWRGHKQEDALEEMINRLLKCEPRLLSMRTKQGLLPKNLKPLELATKSGSQFPRRMLYLLAGSLHCKNDAHYFIDDLFTLSEHTMDGAVELTSRMRSSEREKMEGRRQWLRDCFMRYNTCDIAYLLCRAPVAAAEFLKILTVMPRVEEPGRHPIPSRTLLEELGMRGTYRSEVQWKWAGLQWHSEFVPTPEECQLGRRSLIRDVQVKVVLMPNLLHIDILWALSTCPQGCIEVFEALPVQGAIACLWSDFIETAFYLALLFRIADMLAILLLALTSKTHPRLSAHFGALALAGVLREGITNLCWLFTFAVKARWFDIWSWRLIWFKIRSVVFGVVMNVCKVAAIWMTWQADLNPHGDVGEVQEGTISLSLLKHSFLSASVILMSCKIVDSLQVSEGIGATIFTLQRSLLSGAMVEMLGLLLMFFITFFFAFYILHLDDPDKDGFRWAWVWVTLYRALVFGDGDGLDVGLGVDDQDEQVEGSVDHGISGCLMMFATFVSFIVMLNLIIAVYANEYDAAEQQSIVFFMRERVRTSCYFVLALQKLRPTDERLRQHIHVAIPLAFLLGCTIFPFLSLSWVAMVTAATSLAVGQVLWQLVSVSPEGKPMLNPPPSRHAFQGCRKSQGKENAVTKRQLRDLFENHQLRHGGQSLVKKWLERIRKARLRHPPPSKDYFVWICHRADFQETRFNCGGSNMWLDKKVDGLKMSLEKSSGRRFDRMEERLEHMEERLQRLEQMQETLGQVHSMLCEQREQDGGGLVERQYSVESKHSVGRRWSSKAPSQPQRTSISPRVGIVHLPLSKGRLSPDVPMDMGISPRVYGQGAQHESNTHADARQPLIGESESEAAAETPLRLHMPRRSPGQSEEFTPLVQTSGSRASTQEPTAGKDLNHDKYSTYDERMPGPAPAPPRWPSSPSWEGTSSGLSPAAPRWPSTPSWERPLGMEGRLDNSSSKPAALAEGVHRAGSHASQVTTLGVGTSQVPTELEGQPAVPAQVDLSPLRAAIGSFEAFKLT